MSHRRCRETVAVGDASRSLASLFTGRDGGMQIGLEVEADERLRLLLALDCGKNTTSLVPEF